MYTCLKHSVPRVVRDRLDVGRLHLHLEAVRSRRGRNLSVAGQGTLIDGRRQAVDFVGAEPTGDHPARLVDLHIRLLPLEDAVFLLHANDGHDVRVLSWRLRLFAEGAQGWWDARRRNGEGSALPKQRLFSRFISAVALLSGEGDIMRVLRHI